MPDVTPESILEQSLAELKPFNGQTIVPIVARACEACGYSAKEGNDLVCRRNPPQVTMLAIPGMSAGPDGRPRQGIQMMPCTSFPIMRRDQWCGEFTQKGRN